MVCFVSADWNLWEHLSLHMSSASDPCFYHSIWILSFGLGCCPSEGRRVWLAESSNHLNCSEREHFSVMIRPRLPTTTLHHPLQCRPQCGWLKTGSAALCISSINLGLSVLQWRMQTKAQRTERDPQDLNGKAFHILLLSPCFYGVMFRGRDIVCKHHGFCWH